VFGVTLEINHGLAQLNYGAGIAGPVPDGKGRHGVGGGPVPVLGPAAALPAANLPRAGRPDRGPGQGGPAEVYSNVSTVLTSVANT
jgi:hypothetical protein